MTLIFIADIFSAEKLGEFEVTDFMSALVEMYFTWILNGILS